MDTLLDPLAKIKLKNLLENQTLHFTEYKKLFSTFIPYINAEIADSSATGNRQNFNKNEKIVLYRNLFENILEKTGMTTDEVSDLKKIL